MLVNATAHPGPALWQGIMLIVVVIAVIAIFSVKQRPTESFKAYDARQARVMFISFGLTIFIGVALFVWIVAS